MDYEKENERNLEQAHRYRQWALFTRINDHTGKPIEFLEWTATEFQWFDVTTVADPRNVRRFKRVGHEALRRWTPDEDAG